MKFIGPERYKLSFDSKTFSSVCVRGTNKFSGLATTKGQKLYIVSVNEAPIYVGKTKQVMRSRLRLGWSAAGRTGYYGYRWRHELNNADLDIWLSDRGNSDVTDKDIEIVEAEIVFLIRGAGQWPKYQTEIHFHQSESKHRDAARMIFDRYQC